MHIVTVNTLFDPYILGGAEITVKSIVQGLQAVGHQIDVVTTCDRSMGELIAETRDGIAITRLGLENLYWNFAETRQPGWKRVLWHARDRVNRGMARKAAEAIGKLRPDVVMTHNLVGFSAALWEEIAAQGVPIVHIMHDPYLICPRSNMFHHGKACRRQCTVCGILRRGHPQRSNAVSAVVGVSRFILDLHLRHGYFERTAEKTVIRNARAFDAAVEPRAFAGPAGPLRFGFIGTLAESKGINLLLDAFSRVAAAHPGLCELWVAGRGEANYEAKVRERMEQLPGRFVGYVKPPDFFGEVDVLVVPSIWNDTLPGVVFESLGFGVPVAGARRGGIPEMISEGVNGWLFEPERAGELAGLLEQVLASRARLPDMARAARESAKPFMDRDRMIREYDDLIRRVVSTRGPRKSATDSP